MVDETDNFILRYLQDIRASQVEHGSELKEVRQELRSLNKKIDDWQETTATGVGLAAHANHRVQSLEQELASIRERLSRLEGRH